MLLIVIGFVMFFIGSVIAARLIGNLLDLCSFLLDSLFRYLKNRFPIIFSGNGLTLDFTHS